MKIEQKLDLDKVVENISTHALFSIGKEILEKMQPSFKRLIIQQELDYVSDALALCVSFEPMPIIGFKDQREAFTALEKHKVLSAFEFVGVLSHLQGIAAILSYYKSHIDECVHLSELIDALFYDEKMVVLLENIFDTYGQIKDNASLELATIRKQLRKIENDIETSIEHFKKNHAHQMVDNIVTHRDNRVVMLVKNSEKNVIGGFVHGESGSRKAVYLEPTAFIALNNQKNILLSQEAEEIQKILKMLSEKLRPFAGALHANLLTVGKLDAIFAKAKWGKSLNCCIPSVQKDHVLHLEKTRHPLIDSKKVVSNTYSLSKNKKVMVITGSNTGGKTISLKVIGLMTLMSYCGIPIPCENATIPLFSNVLVDIGDDQSVTQSLSTFSSHLKNLAFILNHVNENSLVLLDELGSGTDPKEGESLAIAILKQLVNNHCTAIVTTHYQQLKAYASQHPEILLAMVEFDMNTLTPTYRFIEGVGGKSYAFEIAKSYGLPYKIIEEAQHLLKASQSESEKYVESLARQYEENEKIQTELLKKQERIEQLEQQLNHQLKQQEAQRADILQQAQQEAALYLEEKIEEINQIAQENASKGSILKKMEAIEEDLTPLKKVDEIFEEGDTVRLLHNHAVGKIVQLHNKKDATVQVGQLKVKVKLRDIEKIKGKAVAGKRVEKIATHKILKASNEINVIGQTVSEAISRIDKFIDDAKVEKYPFVRIIHGNGTGKLRNAIHQFLRNDKTIRSYQLGMPNEGGSGVTVVTL